MSKRRPFLALLVASGGFVIVLDNFAAAVAFPRIEEAFPTTPRSTLAWLSSGNSIALAALLLVAGKLGDRYGRRRTYLSGMAVFMLAALLTAASPNPAWLIAARVVQGCAGAMMVSTSIALALLEYPPERRGVAMGWMGVMGSVSSLLGPVLAGNIIEVGGSWRWVFLVSIPVGVAVLFAGPRTLQEAKVEGARDEPIDLFAMVVVAAASGLLVFGVIQTGRWGWVDGRTGLTLLVAAALWALFVLRCRRAAAPLLDLGLFARPTFRVATVSQLFSQFALFAFFFWTPLFLVNVWGWSSGGVGWATATPLLLSCNSVPMGRFADTHGYRGMLVSGGLVCAASSLWWILAVGDSPSFVTDLLPGMLLLGFGTGMIGINSAAAALAGLEAQTLAAANSAFQTSRRVVQTLGVAVVVAILGDRSSDNLSRFRWVWAVCGIGFVASSLIALWYPGGQRRETAAGADAAAVRPVSDEILDAQ
ncbi:MAG: MFS transporter [Acidimicrobiales bacterium]